VIFAELDLTRENVYGLNWLHKVCETIVDKGDDHRSFDNATHALEALRKLRRYVSEMGDLIDVMNEQQDEAFADAIRNGDIPAPEAKA